MDCSGGSDYLLFDRDLFVMKNQIQKWDWFARWGGVDTLNLTVRFRRQSPNQRSVF